MANKLQGATIDTYTLQNHTITALQYGGDDDSPPHDLVVSASLVGYSDCHTSKGIRL